MKSLINISIISLMIFSCSKKVDGCNDPTSCTYNPDVTNYVHGSCLYIDECGVCGGDNTECLDECGVINGDNTTCLGCDDVLNSGLVFDKCGICDGLGYDCGGSCNEFVELWGECYNIEETIEIHLSGSGISGEIPLEIGDLINLTSLYLSNNQLTGEIPVEIGNLTNLINLTLRKNQLTGDIPSEIGNLVNLTHLILSNNQLTGEIPEEICNQGDSTPNLYNNKFCPPYPDCISEYDISTQDTSDCP